MYLTPKSLARGVREGDWRAVARVLTLAENRSPQIAEILERLPKRKGSSRVIGITGSPGAGKSTLVDRLASELHSSGSKVAILAIDPSSPFSGGAILGDRIRMDSSEDAKIFIRSMATRGARGGLAWATADAVEVLEAAGFDTILIETVGVGQSEIDVVRIAQTCIVVLVPGMGDSVQSMKAGILEIADIFVINKADRDGVDSLERDMRMLLSLDDKEGEGWRPPIVRTVATTATGIKELAASIVDYNKWLRASKEGKARRLRLVRENIIRLALDEVAVLISLETKLLGTLVSKCERHKETVRSAATKLLGKIRR